MQHQPAAALRGGRRAPAVNFALRTMTPRAFGNLLVPAFLRCLQRLIPADCSDVFSAETAVALGLTLGKAFGSSQCCADRRGELRHIPAAKGESKYDIKPACLFEPFCTYDAWGFRVIHGTSILHQTLQSCCPTAIRLSSVYQGFDVSKNVSDRSPVGSRLMSRAVGHSRLSG